MVNNDYVFRVYNGDTTAIGLDVDGNAEFSGTIKSSNIIGESTLQVGAQYDENNNVTGYLTTIDSSGRLTCVNADISGDITADSLTLRKQIQLGNATDGYHTWINTDGTLSTQNANVSGEIRAASGQIGGFTIKPDDTENDKAYGWLYSGTNIGDDKSIFLSATDMTGTMSFSQPVISTDNDGDIIYDENGDVVHGNATLSLTKSNWRITVGSNFGITSDGTAYMSNCEIIGGSLKMGSENSGYYAWISEDGVLNAGGANISGEIHVSDKSTIAGFTIDGNKISSGKTLGSDNSIFLSTTNMNGVAGFFEDNINNNEDDISNWRMTIGSKFGVTSDGKLYANGADINGSIAADNGYIGNWQIIQNSLLGGDAEKESITLSPSAGLNIQALDPSSKELLDEQPKVTATRKGDYINVSLPKNCIAVADPSILVLVYDGDDNLLHVFSWIDGANNMDILASELGDNINVDTLYFIFADTKFYQTSVCYNTIVSIPPSGKVQFRELRADKYYDTQGTLLFEVNRDGIESEQVYFKAEATQGNNGKTAFKLTPYSDSSCSTPSKASFDVIYVGCWSNVLGQTKYEHFELNLTGVSSAQTEIKYVPNRCQINFYNKGQLVSYELILQDTTKPIFIGECGTREYEGTENTKLIFHVPCEFPS